MPNYEYKVVPAPKKGLKGKGVKGTEERFANALMTAMNELGAEGWEYQRADTLPCEERSGVMGKSTSFQNMLVFRRKRSSDAPASIAQASETVAKTHAPLLNGAASADSGSAPELGPATDTKKHETDVAAQ